MPQAALSVLIDGTVVTGDPQEGKDEDLMAIIQPSLCRWVPMLMVAVVAFTLVSCDRTDPPEPLHNHAAPADSPEFSEEFLDMEEVGLRVTVGRPVDTSPLPKMTNLKRLHIYCDFAGDAPGDRRVTETEHGALVFPAILTDQFVRELAKVKTLETIMIWSGSLTDDQWDILKEGLPDCTIGQNVNKL